MAWVYILRGTSGRHYIGSTTELSRRLEEHRRGHTYTTRRMGAGIELVAAGEVGSLSQARTLERKLKRLKRPQQAISLLQSMPVG